jgi:hypothetical protein
VLGPERKCPQAHCRIGQGGRAEDGERPPARLPADRDVDDVDVAGGDRERDDEPGDQDLRRPLELGEQAVAGQDVTPASVGR